MAPVFGTPWPNEPDARAVRERAAGEARPLALLHRIPAEHQFPRYWWVRQDRAWDPFQVKEPVPSNAPSTRLCNKTYYALFPAPQRTSRNRNCVS
jgi:hypothetical protein